MRGRTGLLLAVLLVALTVIMSCSGGGGEGGGNASPSAEQTSSEILNTQNSASQKVTQLVSQGDPNALQNTVTWLKTQTNVHDAAIGADGVSISVQYDSGVEGIILTQPPLVSSSTTTSALANNLPATSYYQTLDLNTSAANKKAIILLPLDSVPDYTDTSASDIKTYLQQSSYAVDVYKDNAVTVDLMKTISNYDFVYMATHGGVGFYGIGTNIQIMTGQVAISSTMANLGDLLTANNGITLMSPYKSNQIYFALNPNFFNNYAYHNAFIYMNVCSSFSNDSLANSFLNHGASAYMGWDNVSFLSLGSLKNSEFFQDFATPNHTLKQSFTSTLAKYYPATVYKDDNNNGKYRVKLLDGADMGDLSDTTINYALSLKYKGNDSYILNSLADTTYLSSIAVTPSSPSISTTETKQFTATGTHSDGTSQDITASVTWTSSNTGIATVNSSGLATGIAAGTATITATSGTISGSTSLTVTTNSGSSSLWDTMIWETDTWQ